MSVALIDGVDVDAVAAAVAACPGVSGLFGGRGDVVASYLPGRRVAGVEVKPAAVTVHVRSRWGVTAAQLLSEIASAVSPLLDGRHLEVVVADIDDEALPARPVDPPAALASAVVGPPGALSRSVVRAPGSSPAPSKRGPRPAPPAFPTV